MKVGDLVKVYNFSHKARRVFPDKNAYVVGLIVSYACLREWRVMIPKWDTTDIYSVNRLEIINESR